MSDVDLLNKRTNQHTSNICNAIDDLSAALAIRAVKRLDRQMSKWKFADRMLETEKTELDLAKTPVQAGTPAEDRPG